MLKSLKAAVAAVALLTLAGPAIAQTPPGYDCSNPYYYSYCQQYQAWYYSQYPSYYYSPVIVDPVVPFVGIYSGYGWGGGRGYGGGFHGGGGGFHGGGGHRR